MKQTLTAAFLLLSCFACNKSDTGYPVLSTDAKPESVLTVTRSVEIGSESYTAEFGTIRVIENRSNPASRLISIPFLRIHSLSEHPAEPIFGLAGGPGQTNMSWDRGKAWSFLPNHDFVLVGYRGIDGSTVLDCPEVTEAFTGDEDPLSDESMKRIGRAWTAGAERLKTQGIDLDGYSMLDCIEDIESVRRALGYERINLLSESYGTRVAYLYGLKYPDRIFRSAMISVNPPGHFVWEPEMTDRQLRYYAALWSRDSTASAKSPDLYGSMRNVLNSMPRRWLFFSINPGKVRVVTFALLFHRKTAAMVFNAYVSAEQGDPSGLALMSLAYDYVMPSLMKSGDLASKAVSADFDASRDYRADTDSLRAPLGAPMSKLLWGSLRHIRWSMKPLPEEFRRLRPSNVQTLLLSGSVDFSTPPEYATNELLPYLKNGKQVILSEYGHVGDMWYVDTKNTRLLLTSFFDTGIPNTSLNSYVPMDFSVSWGFPTIAKAALGAILFVGIALIALIVWIIRRITKRRRLGIVADGMNS